MSLLNIKRFFTCFPLWKVDCSTLDIWFDHRGWLRRHGSTDRCREMSCFALIVRRLPLTPISVSWKCSRYFNSSRWHWGLYRWVVCFLCKETLRMDRVQTFSKTLCNRLQHRYISCPAWLLFSFWCWALPWSHTWATGASSSHACRLFDLLVQVIFELLQLWCWPSYFVWFCAKYGIAANIVPLSQLWPNLKIDLIRQITAGLFNQVFFTSACWIFWIQEACWIWLLLNISSEG